MISPEIIKELWDSGFTLTRRLQDPTNIPAGDIPAGRAYQWMHLAHDRVHFEGRGWAPVPHSRHPGRFAPWGTTGNIEWNGLGLFEKPKFEVEADHAASHAKAHQNVQDWIDRTGAEFSGHVAVGVSGDIKAADVGKNTIENVTSIPKDMFEHMSEIFAERDRLRDEHLNLTTVKGEDSQFSAAFTKAMDENPTAEKWPTLHAIILPVAIQNVRARLASSQEA